MYLLVMYMYTHISTSFSQNTAELIEVKMYMETPQLEGRKYFYKCSWAHDQTALHINIRHIEKKSSGAKNRMTLSLSIYNIPELIRL